MDWWSASASAASAREILREGLLVCMDDNFLSLSTPRDSFVLDVLLPLEALLLLPTLPFFVATSIVVAATAMSIVLLLLLLLLDSLFRLEDSDRLLGVFLLLLLPERCESASS